MHGYLFSEYLALKMNITHGLLREWEQVLKYSDMQIIALIFSWKKLELGL